MLQEQGVESVVKTVGIVNSHTSYFDRTDVANFIVMKVHNQRISVNITGVNYNN